MIYVGSVRFGLPLILKSMCVDGWCDWAVHFCSDVYLPTFTCWETKVEIFILELNESWICIYPTLRLTLLVEHEIPSIKVEIIFYFV